MTPVDPDDPIVTVVIPVYELVGRLVGVIETLSRRVDILELELAYRRDTDADRGEPSRRAQ